MAFARSTIRNGQLLIATTFAFAMLTSVSQAYTQEQQQMCTGDAMRLCGAEIPDVDRVTACMVAKQSQLSPGCRVFFRGPEPSAAPARPTNLRPATARRPVSVKPASVKPRKSKKPAKPARRAAT